MKYKRRKYTKTKIDRAIRIAIHRFTYKQIPRREFIDLFYSNL